MMLKSSYVCDRIALRKALMTACEIISIFLGILTLLFTFGSLIVALLAFLDKRIKRK